MINEVEERNRKKKEERGKPAGKKKKISTHIPEQSFLKTSQHSKSQT
jgi:hypothetical protein